ncbi:hypothetical protein [Alloalcanivorax mobilis]|uniref:hypothetical protein n=1 Tax=Alloalcanivorax mobilis TaxID=2019569 RepID=UPI000B5B2D88|nr:hypothetical protein [Alloalcanivorax mobilis]ASK35658.1 hypothetical protein CEK62_15350 [Alcanivorax sp. N3-2A]|tara:strand:+ start:6219 stop:7094 length:876 start_codon:yes stop_codon:yes gene_type:complete
MTDFTPKQALLGALIAALALGGCATTDSDARQAVEMVDSEAALDTPQPDWDTPFWERFSKSDNSAQANASTQAFQRRDEPLNNVGVLIEGNVNNADAFMAALRDGAPQHGFVIVPPGTLREAMNNTQGCGSSAGDSGCLAGLAIYPGVRLLANVKANGQGGLDVTLRDTTRDNSASATLNAASEQSAGALLDELEARAGSARWSVKAFDGGDGHLYISAGRRNGLDLGTELQVRQPGTPIRTPAGQVVAWRPGAVSGTVKVTQWVGEGMSVIETVSGTAPTASDWLTLPRE